MASKKTKSQVEYYTETKDCRPHPPKPETNVITGYGLRKKDTGKLLGVEPHAETYNDGDDYWSAEMEYTLTEYSGEEAIWIVKDKLAAAYARSSLGCVGSCAGYDNPINPYKPEELEVVWINLATKSVPVKTKDYPLLSSEEYIRKKYGIKGLHSYNLPWMEFQLKQIKELGEKYPKPTLLDLRMLYYDLDFLEQLKKKEAEKK